MKRCPTCTRTFLDEHLSYCIDDGTPLVEQAQSSSFDPQSTVLDPTPQATRDVRESAQTRPFRPDEMPGGWPQPHSWKEPSAPLAPPVTPSWGAPATPPAAWTPPPPPGGQYAVRKSQQNPIAIASLALGVFSLTIGLCCYLGLGAGPIAVILGAVSLSQMKNSPTQSASKGMAIAGIATGAVAFGINLLFIILGVAMSSFR